MTEAHRTASPIKLHKELTAIWGPGTGIERLAAVNHSVLGKRFVITAFVFFAIGGGLGMLIRTQLATSASAFMDEGLYAQIFTMHGTIMMFLFAIPLFEGFAIYLLPKLVGARDFAFPRLTAYSYWCYLFGGTMLIVGLLAGVAPDSGWFMYTPLSSRTYTPGINADLWLLGIAFVEISAICTAVEIAASVLKVRAPGMSLDRMPIFAWYMLVVALMMLIGFPPLILGSILLEVERAFDLPFFDPARGGDPLLWQHLFWLFGHPEVYIIFLPAAGLVSTFLPVFAGRPLVGYTAIVVAVIAMAFLSFGLWVHHMYATGIPHLGLSFFAAASVLVTIPTAVQIFAWLATLSHGTPRYSLPMLYVFGMFFVFVIGGLTGVMLAIVPFNLQAHDTHFVVAHLHYVLIGGFVLPMIGAAYHWLPHVTGRLPSRYMSAIGFWTIFAGFNVTFLVMHLTGLRGMPRRIHTYIPELGWETLNLISSIGSFVMTIGFAIVVIDLLLLMRFTPRSRRNPWSAATLEWAMPIPPPSYNFASLPTIDRRADRLDPGPLAAELAGGRGYLAFTRHGHMETLGVEMIGGDVEHVIVLPRQTYRPLITAIATGAFFVLMLLKLYWMALATLPAIVVCFLLWTRDTGLEADTGPVPIGRGETAQYHYESRDAPSWWAMAFTLAANATLYVSLLFGSLFLWVSAPNWPPSVLPDLGVLWPASAAVAALCAAAFGARAVHMAGRRPFVPLGACAASHTLASVVLLGIAIAGVPSLTAHALSAAIFVILIYLASHHALGAVFALFGAARVHSGKVSALRTLDLRIGRQWHDYCAVATVVGLAFVAALIGLVGSEPA
ncbi:QoxA, quinol oxidase subunit I [Hyphomicrobium nitrativorans NL23]|uniref:cytochrome-c oxidase n=1 Tax=Hyphomicrobium nitrativorans NL23 TaxID=1029756 RepID=V5SFH0_9HYPH|nr:cytochrome c oxidase subunit I [Hyphomicrobium nitrativorans]AHB49247.1 QoxA, quinol oxidase subunit I [Hyphomicrobium nitrativorans NL23]